MPGRVRSLAVGDVRLRTLFHPDMMKDAELAAVCGWTHKQLAEYWGVSEKTVERWQRRYPSTLGTALKIGSRRAEAGVSTALLSAAQGKLVRSETSVPMLDPAGNPRRDPVTGEKLMRTTRTYQPFNVVAAIFYSCNRWPDRWKNVQRVEVLHEGQGVKDLVFVVAGKDGAERRVELGDAGAIVDVAPDLDGNGGRPPPALPPGNGGNVD